jgi:hypothetical protein
MKNLTTVTNLVLISLISLIMFTILFILIFGNYAMNNNYSFIAFYGCIILALMGCVIIEALKK